MKYFWGRFIVFVLLWTYLIIQYSTNSWVSILCFAGAMAGFFFLSLKKVPIYVYILLSLIIFLHGLLIAEENLITIILLVYISMIASFRLRENKLKLYILMNLLLSILLSYLQMSHVVAIMVMVVFLYFLLLSINQYVTMLQEQRNLYEELRSEYRKLKRMNLLAEETARVEERNRIARDIHDSVGHRLTALIMKLETLAIQTKNEDYRELKKMAEDSLGETRQAVKTLQAEESEGIATVVHLIRKLEAESQIVVQFTIKQGVLTVPLSNDHSVVLYRVLQEALTNAMRHGYSREIHVVLGKSAIGDVTFEISNTVYEVKPFTFGFGLTNMKKRLEEIGGRLDVYQKENQFYVSGIIPSE
ncbi:histidine kinase [Ornithinibacillus sp. FSL M8-0202]|uniref:sensor histidine kinase n=1 Tax=Ornithinibacillus sp. FSL M8-0202 TaxID=2921616 RepID=UPI0030D0C924